ncbi:Hypothetical protein D9617_49g041300 [Elsinoe fawcettii]|nr:Hypothetical protein D9617_49g041300 [Elsinoe fawcettii]
MARELKDQDQQRKYTNIVPIRPSTIAKPQDKFAHAIMLLNNKTREIKFYTVRGRDARGMLDEGFQVSFCRAVRKAYDISDPIGNNDKDPQHSESFHLDQLLFELLGFDFVPESGDRSYEVLDEYTREVLVDDEPDTQTDGPIHSSIHGLFKDIDTSQDMKHRLQPYRDASVLLDLIEKYLASSVESMNNTEELLRTMTLQLSQLDRELFPMAADQIEQALGQLRKGSDNMTKLECFVSRAKQRIQHVRQAKEAYTARLRSYLRELECIENI